MVLIFPINSSTNLPFDYQLSISPISNTITQSETIKANINVTYLQGKPQAVTLTVTANSTVAQINLSSITGIPKPNDPYTSNLTIHILDSAQSSAYSINITANSSNNKTYSTKYNIEVLNSQIQVLGTVSTISSDSIYPLDLQFVNLQTNVTYTANLTFASLTKANLLQQATYSVMLPNQQSYKVIGTWARLFGPWSSPSDLPQGTFDCGILQVDCKVGQTTINKDYQDSK